MDKHTAARVKSYWGKMLNQIKHLEIEKDWNDIEERLLAPVEHIFDCHQYCQQEWCYSLKAKKEGKHYTPPQNKPFFDKTNSEESESYVQLKNVLKRFQTKKVVNECLHKFDMQQNESLNNVIARYAPKFKHFRATTSLNTRVSIVVVIN